MKTSGYLGTPLAKKLGIKPGFKIKLVNSPDYYFKLFSDLPEKITFLTDKKTKKNLIHFFALHSKDFHKELTSLKSEIEKDGCIWVSWPKKACRMTTDVTEDIIRNMAVDLGLVDIKVCAVDEVWSGLKLVIPVKSR